jgi:hypothetical protein
MTYATKPLGESNPHAREAERLGGHFDDGSPNAGPLAQIEATLAVAWELRALRREVASCSVEEVGATHLLVDVLRDLHAAVGALR